MSRNKIILRRSALLISTLLIFLALLTVSSIPVLAASVSVSPASGPVGTTVTITGTDFDPSISITVLFDSTTMLSNIVSSASGAWSASFTVPASVSGGHAIVAYGGSNTYSAYFYTIPAIALSKTSGAPGSSVTVTGSGFVANESGIKITFDSTSVTTTSITAGSTGSWSGTFIVPASESGTHSVTAKGNSTSTVTAVTFTTSAGISINKSSGAPGTAVTVSGVGFVSGETGITVTFDGDEVASGIAAGTTGGWSTSFNVPASASGSHAVGAFGNSTVAGSVSGASFKTSAAISINPSKSSPGSSVTVTGSGFGNGETNIVVTFDGTQVGSSTSANSIGAWTITFTIPTSASGSHVIAASGSVTTAKSVANVSFSIGAGLSLSKSSGAPGTSTTVTGSGFGANETGIIVTFDSSPVASDIRADSSGSWSSTFIVPPSTSGSHAIAASGKKTLAASVAGISFDTAATIAVDNTSGSPGTPVTVTGSGFDASETGITVTFDGNTVASNIVADDSGSWTTTFNVPPATSGSHIIKASGPETAVTSTSQSAFNIAANVSLSPSTGYVGSTVTVTGTGFAANSTLRITYDGTEVTLNDATTDAAGSIDQSITIPVSKAGSHTITITDSRGNTVKSSFTISSTPPSVPSGISPKDNSTISITGGITPVFKWTAVTSQNSVTYELQVGTDMEFSDVVLDKTGLQTNKYTLSSSEALPRGTYYWRVKAVDLASNQSAWSEIMALKSGMMAPWMLGLVIVLVLAVIALGLYFGLIRRMMVRKREAITVSEVETPVFSPGQWQALESGEATKEREAPRRIALPEVSKTSKTMPTEDQARLKVILDFARSMPLVEPDFDVKWLMDQVENQLQTQISVPVYEQILKGDYKLRYEPTWMRHPVYKDLTTMLQKQPILQKLDTFVTEVGLCGTDALSLIQQIHSQSAAEIPADFLSRGGWSYLTAIYIDAVNWYAGKSLRDPTERDYIIASSNETEKEKTKCWLSGESNTLFSGHLISTQDEQEAQQLRTIHLKLRRTWRNSEKIRQICSSITQLQLERSELVNAFNQFGRPR